MIETIDLKKHLFEDVGSVNDKLTSLLDRIENQKLRSAAAHILNAGGKRIRPSVMLTVYKALGGTELSKAISIASSVEMIHNWTLIHDDIIDESDVRRGVETVHVKWDRDVAILAGDMLNNLAFEVICLSGFDQRTVARMTCVISRASMEVIDGEMMDVDFETRNNVTQSDYFEMIGKKTGALFSCSTACGAIMASATAEQEQAVHQYGKHIGLAFQVKDDLLDLVADQAEFGKEVGKDIQEGKKTLMVLHALNNTDVIERDELTRLLEKQSNTPEEVARVLEIMHDAGSISYSEEVLRNSINEAVAALEVLPGSQYRDVLEELAHYIGNRNK